MERHANYALVGVLTTLLIFGGLVFAVWLGNYQFAEKNDHYRVVFAGPVRGLSQGGEIQFNGIKAGEIEKIGLSPNNTTQVLIDIKLAKGTPVRVDSLASTEMQGISGVNVIQISAGSAGKPLLKTKDTSDRPVIPSKPNALASLLEGGGEVIQNANEALERVNRLLSDRNIATVGHAIQDLRSVTGEFAANRAMFARAGSAFAKLDSAAGDVQSAAASVKTIANGDGKRAVADVAAAASELKLAVNEARGVIRKFDGQSDTIGTTTLPRVNATMLSVQQTAETLDDLLRQIRADPRGTLTKSRGKELELPK